MTRPGHGVWENRCAADMPGAELSLSKFACEIFHKLVVSRPWLGENHRTRRRVAEDRWEPDPADVERRKKELLAAARGERSDDGPNPMVGLGLQFVVIVLVCLFAGQWLDRKLGTTPWMLLAGMMLGAGVGLWTMLRVMRQQDAEARGRDSGRRGRRGQDGKDGQDGQDRADGTGSG